MPGAGMIGERHAHPAGKNGKTLPTAQAAQVRNLGRLLNLLQDPETATVALLAAVEQSSIFKRKHVDFLRASLDRLQQDGWETFRNHASIEMAQAVEDTFHVAIGKEQPRGATSAKNSKRKSRKSAYALFYGDCARQYKGVEELKGAKGKISQFVAQAWKDLSVEQKEEFQARAEAFNREADASTDVPQTITAATVEKTAAASAIVSDSETGSRSLVVSENDDDVDLDKELALIDFWPNLIESMQLQVSSRTTRTWGRKKIYEVYRLAGPTMPVSDLQKLRASLSKEFLALYDGSSVCQESRLLRHGECRVFAAQRSEPAALWVQLNIGRPFDCHDESQRSNADGQKKKKPANEFVAMILPESNLVALTASRRPSRSVFTPCVLSALETVLTCSVAGGYASGGTVAQRVHDLTGTEPFELLRTAMAIETADAVGRYSHYASIGSSSDPIADLQQASSGSLLRRNKQQERLKAGAKHGREIAHRANEIDAETNGQARLTSISSRTSCIDHSAKEQTTRKRNRDFDFGGQGDCPQCQCVRWDWKGLTSAPHASWNSDNGNNNVASTPQDLFKCRVTLKGSDVFEGMRALMDAGIMKGPLPHYVRDAPMLGETIAVDCGAVSSIAAPKKKTSN